MNNLINKLKERAATYKQFGIDPKTQELLEEAAKALEESCQGTLTEIPPNTYIKIESEEHSKYVQELAFKSGFEWRRSLAGKDIQYTQQPYIYFEKGFCLGFGTDLYCDLVAEDGSKEILVDMNTGTITYVN